MPASETTRRRWLAYLLSTEPADRPRAETAVRDLYTAAGLEAPRCFCWFDSPAAACWAVAALLESRQASYFRRVAHRHTIAQNERQDKTECSSHRGAAGRSRCSPAGASGACGG